MIRTASIGKPVPRRWRQDDNSAKIANPRLNIRTRPNMSPSRPKLTTSTAVTTR